METSRYNADDSSIGEVTPRPARSTAATAPTSVRLASPSLGTPASAGSHFSSGGAVTSAARMGMPAPSAPPRRAAASASSALPRFAVVPPVPAVTREAPSEQPPSATKNIKHWFSQATDQLQARIAGANRKAILAFSILATVVFCVVALYGPLRDYYVARRSNEYLSVQLEALETANSAVEEKLEALQTPEGIEDEARRRGYIERGSNAVNVVGLPEDTDAQNDGEAAFTKAKEVPVYWYTELLDKFFGYEPPTS